MENVLVIPDTHCPGMLSRFPNFLLETYKQHKCSRVVHIGDLVDWHAINFHGKEQGTPDARQETRNARKQVKKLYDLFPEVDWLLGNHDSLPRRRAAESGLDYDLLKAEKEYWELDRWTVHERWTALEIDGVLYSHGECGAGGQFAAMRQASDNFQSTVIGHFHASAGVWWTANPNNLIFGLAVGCGIDRNKLQFTYGKKFPKKPIIGCGVVLGGKNAHFIPMRLR